VTRIVLVPHTHWDREWYLPFDGFLERLVPMLDGLIDVLDRDERFAHFHLDGQVALIDDYLEVRPEREADVRRLAEAGRLSVGPWYTQMDEFLTSGESHIRNLERGRARAGELRGGDPDPPDGPPFGYLPDQFGHIGQMPQILANAGIRHAVVWRGVPSAIDRTAFWWEAPDGSRVLTDYLAFGYGVGWHVGQQQDAEGMAGALRDAAELIAPFAARDRILVMVGGDHAVAQAQLPPLLAEAGAQAGMDAAFGSVASYLEGSVPEGLPSWRGELRSAARAHLLPNVYSNRVHQKRERARVEALLERYAEPLAALVPGFEWPAAELARAWRLLLWNGAHDSVCGCSVDQVARDVDARHAEARGIAQAIVDRALAALAAQVDTGPDRPTRHVRLMFNPSPFEREGVPGLGWSARSFGWTTSFALRRSAAPVERDEDLFRIEGDRIALDGLALRFVDEADVGDLYTFCPSDDGTPRGPDRMFSEGGAVVLFPGITITVGITKRGDEPFLRFHGRIRNDRTDHRLRLHVELPERANGSVAVSPFEIVNRPLVSEGSDLEAGSAAWPARGAVLAGGVAVLAEGVFEYEVVDGRELAVTLLRSVGTISRETLVTRPWAAGPDVPTPDAQMIGETEFSLGVFAGATREDLLEAWERFALPVLSRLVEPRPDREDVGVGEDPPGGSLLEVRGAELSSVRTVDDALEVRLWNPGPASREAVVGGRTVVLGAARIETVRVDRS